MLIPISNFMNDVINILKNVLKVSMHFDKKFAFKKRVEECITVAGIFGRVRSGLQMQVHLQYSLL